MNYISLHPSPSGLHKTQLPVLLFVVPEIIPCTDKHVDRYAPCFAQILVRGACFPQSFLTCHISAFCVGKYRSAFLSVSTTDTLGRLSPWRGGCAYTGGGFTGPLASSHQTPLSAASLPSAVTTKNMSPGIANCPLGGKLALSENA